MNKFNMIKKCGHCGEPSYQGPLIKYGKHCLKHAANCDGELIGDDGDTACDFNRKIPRMLWAQYLSEVEDVEW